MTDQQILERTFSVIHDKLRHAHYTRTVQVAEKAYRFVTGDGLEKELQRFTLSETEQEFQARLLVTSITAPIVIRSIIGTCNKVPRSRFKRIIEFDESDISSKKVKLEELLSSFNGDDGNADKYVDTRFIQMNAVDPNAWEVTEFEPFEDTRFAAPYPFEVKSSEAVDFVIDRNRLQFLNVLLPITVKSDMNGGTIQGEKYTVYLKNRTVVITQVYAPDENVFQKTADQTYIFDGDYLHSRGRLFRIENIKPHNLGYVPAKRFGFVPDGQTDGKTFEPIFAVSYPVLESGLKTESELALVTSYSAFPHRVEFVPKCDATGCHEGTLVNGDTCGTCHGTGMKEVTSHAHVRRIPMPSPDQLFDLTKLLAFIAPDISVLEWMEGYVTRLEARARKAVFRSDIFSRSEIAATATEKNIDLQNLYDTLFDVATAMSEFWSHIVWTVAGLTVGDEGLKAEKVYSKDFQFKPIIELIGELESANRANAGVLVKQSIMRQIIEQTNEGNQEAIDQWELTEKINPFSGMTENDINFALNSALVPQKYKTLYLMLPIVSTRLNEKLDGKRTENMTPELVQSLVDQIILEIENEARADAPVLSLNPAV